MTSSEAIEHVYNVTFILDCKFHLKVTLNFNRKHYTKQILKPPCRKVDMKQSHTLSPVLVKHITSQKHYKQRQPVQQQRHVLFLQQCAGT